VLAAMPAMAQVQWNTIGGKTGPSACPDGISENRATLLQLNAIQAGATSVTISNATLNLSSLRTWAGGNPGTVIGSVVLAVRDSDDIQVGRQNLTLGNPIAQQSTAISNLKTGQRYVARIEVAPGSPTVVIEKCFQMPPNLNYVENLGTGTLGATGCFAIGEVALGGGEAAIRACFCGARNRLGKWARTGTVEPGTNLMDDTTYKWMLPATERTRQGCTTN